MKKRRKYSWVLIVAALVLCLTATTTAFLTRQVVTDNVLTFGNLKMVIHQTTISSNGDEVPVTENIPTNITSNDVISRIVRFENVGEHPMYVRVSIDMNGITSEGTEFDANNMIAYQVNEEDWIYSDGWYYYKQPLEPNETTQELMSQIVFVDMNSITQEYPGSRFDMKMDAQAVQSENNAQDVLSAAGWPEQ